MQRSAGSLIYIIKLIKLKAGTHSSLNMLLPFSHNIYIYIYKYILKYMLSSVQLGKKKQLLS